MATIIHPNPESDPMDETFYDEISPDDARQAEAGTLFTIQGERFQNVQWSIHRVRNRAELMADPGGDKTEWVLDVVGDLNGADLLPQIGGGTFRFYGYVPRADGGRKLGYNRLISLAGPRKDFSAPPPVPNVPVANGHDPATLVLLERINARLERLERTPAPPQSLGEIVQALVALDTLRGRGAPPAPASDTQIAKEMFQAMSAAMSKGLELGQARDPLPPSEDGGSDVLRIVQGFVPLAEKILDRMAAAPPRRPMPPPPPPRPSTHQSGAETVADTEPARPVAGEVDGGLDMGQARMMALMDAMARAIEAGEDPADFAGTVSDVLTEPELTPFLVNPPELVIGQIVQLGVRYPVLATEQARAFVASVLSELKAEPGTE